MLNKYLHIKLKIWKETLILKEMKEFEPFSPKILKQAYENIKTMKYLKIRISGGAWLAQLRKHVTLFFFF